MSGLAVTYDWLAGLDPRVWQAFVAGVFLAFGWIFNGVQNRREAKRLRDEKLRDVHRALFAEIETNLANLIDSAALEEPYLDQTIEKMRANPDFIPFIPKERKDRLFDTIKAEIHILPRVTIDPVVRYYSQLDSIDALAQDMRGNTFKTLETERRIDMYVDFIYMRKQAHEYGRLANYLIKIYADQGKDAAVTASNTYAPASSSPSDQSAT